MIIPNNETKPDRKELREFALTMSAAIGGLFGLVIPWLLDRAWPLWPWPLALAFLALGAFAPYKARPIFRFWMLLGQTIGRITTPIILGILFYLVISPTGLIRRMIGGDPMSRRIESEATTYKKPSQKPNMDHLERPF